VAHLWERDLLADGVEEDAGGVFPHMPETICKTLDDESVVVRFV